MTKGEIISVIKQRKAGGLADRTVNLKMDDRIIQRYMDFVLEDWLNQYILNNPVTDDFLRRFYPPVLWDSKNAYAYVRIPASMVNLPNNQGLQWISGTEDDTSWIVSRSGLSSVFERVGVTNMNAGWKVHIEDRRVIIEKMPKYLAKGCVLLKIFCGTNGYTMNDEFKIPGTPAAYIDAVCKLMDELKQTPVKMSNDGNPNTP